MLVGSVKRPIDSEVILRRHPLLRRTLSSVFTPFPPGIEPQVFAWQSIIQPLRHVSGKDPIHMKLKWSIILIKELAGNITKQRVKILTDLRLTGWTWRGWNLTILYTMIMIFKGKGSCRSCFRQCRLGAGLLKV